MSDSAVVNNHLAELESELERLSKSVDEIHAAQEAATQAVSSSKSVLSILEQVSKGHEELQLLDRQLGNEMHDVLNKISQVDFPSRLDKLENHLVHLHHALMLQRRISFAIAALVIAGVIASVLLR